MWHGFFVDNGYLIILAAGIFGMIITYRGREFSWRAFVMVLAIDLVFSHFMRIDDTITIFDWKLMEGWTVVLSVLGQIFMGLWFYTHPPICPWCSKKIP